jgi:Protein of unknown function (DUF3179)
MVVLGRLMPQVRSITRRELGRWAGLGIGVRLEAAVGDPDLPVFYATTNPNEKIAQDALAKIARAWRPFFTIMFAEMLRLDWRAFDGNGNAPQRQRFTDFLVKQTGRDERADPRKWSTWVWSLPYDPHPRYAEFKGFVYAFFDPAMHDFFPDANVPSRIRLDQVEWGGVRVNGIPPLVHPKILAAKDASYLSDSDRVFGIEAGGEARAYPKRILAWHEMALDRVGGVDLTVVYCTLCGTVIPYRSAMHTFGTSGLLYESSKLMFDEKTKSLWSTLQGEPVIGPLANSGIALEFQAVETTTWGEWRSMHPRTTVLSLDTGYRRDYGEGVAYRDYFATEDLMFEVSRSDSRLQNKDEVLAIRLPGKTPLAFSVKYLAENPKLSYAHEGVKLEILTSREGANRVYRGGHAGDQAWRVAAFRAFWFGWFAQYPKTVLVK